MELDCHKWNGSLRTVSFDLWQCNSNYGSVLPFNCRTWSFPRIFKTLSKKTHPRNESLWIKDLFKYHRWSITTRESHPQSQQWKIGNMRKIGIWFFRYLLHRMNFYYSFTLVHYFHQSFFLMYCFCQCWSHYSFFLIRYR